MRKLTSRGLIAVAMVATLGLCTPVLASASSYRQGSSSSSRASRLAIYLAARRAIQVTFRDAVSHARATYQIALAMATSSSQRSAARQVFETAIIQAAAARSAALTALGPEPGKKAE